MRIVVEQQQSSFHSKQGRKRSQNNRAIIAFNKKQRTQLAHPKPLLQGARHDGLCANYSHGVMGGTKGVVS